MYKLCQLKHFDEKLVLSSRMCRGTQHFWPSLPSVLLFCRETREYTSLNGEYLPLHHLQCPTCLEPCRPARFCSLCRQLCAVLWGRGHECPASPQGVQGVLR